MQGIYITHARWPPIFCIRIFGQIIARAQNQTVKHYTISIIPFINDLNFKAPKMVNIFEFIKQETTVLPSVGQSG